MNTIKTPTYVALGNFDGVHRGHRQVIQPILQAVLADRLAPTGEAIAPFAADRPAPIPTVVTFHPHPREFFTGEQQPLLTPLDEKVQYLRSIGVEQLVLLPFNQELASLTPQEFVDVVLVQHLQAKRISVGQDFCFGRQRSGTTADLQRLAAEYGIPVEISPLHTCQGERISSSAIRHALTEGNLQRTNQLLGRPYRLVGQVVQGQQLGRTIGFPTANLQVPTDKFLPRQGVYAVRVQNVEWTNSQAVSGVMNIGYRPTVNGTQQTVEVHLFDWSEDLYGQTLSVDLEHFLRPEMKFASLDELKAQIQADSEQARLLLAPAVNEQMKIDERLNVESALS